MPSDRRGEVPAGSAPVGGGDGLAWARGERWLPDPLLTTVEEAGAFFDRGGVAVLFPAERVTAPSLWEAVAGPGDMPFPPRIGPAEQSGWGWEEEPAPLGAAGDGQVIHQTG